MQVTEHFDTMIIGAGAAGLYAAHELSLTHTSILIVEARDRIGGRIYTNTPASFAAPIEHGAEFIHGEASLTFKILEEAGIGFTELKGKMYRVEKDEQSKRNFFTHEWDTMLDELKKLKHDMTLKEFMREKFPKEANEDFYDSIRRFVEGYNAADFARVSAMALSEEWGEEEDPAQYRVDGGYTQLINFLAAAIRKRGVRIETDSPVMELTWAPGHVQVRTPHKIFAAKRCIITVPVSLLAAQSFPIRPEVPEQRSAASHIGFGGVTKINMEFDEPFWEIETRKKFKSAQFIFTDGDIPTWWTQVPTSRPLLTGWVGGPSAAALDLSDQEIFELAIKTLSYAFDYPAYRLKERMKAWHIDQWLKENFSQGAYSYMQVGSKDAVKVLTTPVANTLYFAGEAAYEGPHKSTVEAALTSGRDVAKKILEELA